MCYIINYLHVNLWDCYLLGNSYDVSKICKISLRVNLLNITTGTESIDGYNRKVYIDMIMVRLNNVFMKCYTAIIELKYNFSHS